MAMKFNLHGLTLLILLSATCFGQSGIQSRSRPQKPVSVPEKNEVKLKKAIIYIENSESMFGYVSQISEYVDVLAELSEKPEFVRDKIPVEFNFINGTGPTLTPLGNNPSVLKNKLNRAGFSCGDITRSNLNGMFQVALKNAVNNAITLLISDGIYDIGGTGINSLVTEGKGTRSQFISRLVQGDLQTIIIKLRSRFDGEYFYTSKSGKIKLNGTRPYYIWIFGDSKLLNLYFPNEYISTKLAGFENMARFIKPGTVKVSYQATAEKSAGTFRFDRNTVNRLNDAKPDKHGLGFQFSIAVDYSKLPYPESYLTSADNYIVPEKYSIVSITKPATKIYGVSFTPTHLITVKTMKNPAGMLTLSLVNRVPAWIKETSSDSENNILQDKSHTFGFSYLTGGMIQAYESVSDDKSIAAFNIDIHL
ncbi:MAG TPA: hypothetical protein PKJ24_05575 [Prolixibacteraceae bacterium]|nr:hypothetical protein [Prolixibacteraceae bacterium]